ncbi:MAG TPA: 23S rRNA (adenine(2503)-C(2))-methyltransferase RlmN [Thermodesulfobacteriota bacterium]|nr:23S rRNA (adenine(2503)-C(2))-methyltransferase RlmN [Thermodesulfobacteriota bacterium]
MNACPEKIDLKSLGISELRELIASLGKERYRMLQVLKWLYPKGVRSIDEMTNLSKRFREDLSRISTLSTLLPLSVEEAKDGTKKFLFQLEDRNRIESVLIPEKSRRTLCISTQAGCAMGCRFCLTGKKGLKRNLTTSEILNQISAARRILPENVPITNIVLMGMGEPLANYENTLKAIELMAHPDAYKFSSRRITLSTAGLLPEIEQLGKTKITFRLAVSLNASNEETRSYLMPINRRYPLKDLLAACRRFPLRPRTRITFEYVLIEGFNDSSQDARDLVKILRGIPSKVNLIPLNEGPALPFKRPPEEKIRGFQAILMESGLTAIVRVSKGTEISAACGQLESRVGSFDTVV